MRVLAFDDVFVINGRLAIKLITFSKLLHYSDVYLLRVIKKLFQRGIKIGFKWKKNWYIFLPTTPIKSIILNNKNQAGGSNESNDVAITPSGNSINTDWGAAIDQFPPSVNAALERLVLSVVTVNDRLVVPVSSTELVSSTLGPKKLTQFIAPNLGLFPAIKAYKYGDYIIYDETKMSTFDPGTNGSLKSTQLPQAFFEVCRALDAAENTRNGANPGLPARRNLSTTVSFDTGTIAVAGTIPIATSIQSDGTIQIVASDYLGGTYSAFTNGGGDLTSTNIVAAFFETASLLSAAEKAVTPVENQPNNIQITIDVEAGSAAISGNIPFTTAAATNGDVTIKAIDYL